MHSICFAVGGEVVFPSLRTVAPLQVTSPRTAARLHIIARPWWVGGRRPGVAHGVAMPAQPTQHRMGNGFEGGVTPECPCCLLLPPPT